MFPIIRPLRYLTLRRSLKRRPVRVRDNVLPSWLYRPLTIQAPGPISANDNFGPAELHIENQDISASPSSSGSQHPFAERDGSNESSSSRSVATTLPSPPEKVSLAPPPHLQHPFDTHAFVSYLEKADLTPTTSRTLMEAVKLLIVRRGEKVRDEMVGKEDMENVS